MELDKTDWSAIWRDGIIFFAGRADKATSWNRGAPRWNKENAGDYGKQVIKRIKIKPNWTVLDVGCGPGLLAIPVAKKCKHLTGLDVSSEMLKYLKQNAELKKVHNISYVNIPFETAIIGKDVKKHDVVVASRSMGWEYNLEKFLRNMDEAAKKRAYVVWGASDRAFDIGMYKAIGRPYGETRMYIVIYNLLYQMGIRANIEIFETEANAIPYKSVDEALSELSKRFERRDMNEELNEEEKIKLRKYLEETLKESKKGTFSFMNEKPAKHALMWWDKKLNS
jgi:ubiquinone/menaquinone biosynthesis C-methylase UbiE